MFRDFENWSYCFLPFWNIYYVKSYPQISVSPNYLTTPDIGNTLSVDIEVDAVNNLYAFNGTFYFDPTTLRVVDADPNQSGIQIEVGTFLDTEHQFILINQVDNEAGIIEFSMTQVHPAQARTGTGVLATILFERHGGLYSPIRLDEVQLVDNTMPNPQMIPTGIQQGQVGNAFFLPRIER